MEFKSFFKLWNLKLLIVENYKQFHIFFSLQKKKSLTFVKPPSPQAPPTPP